MRAYLRDRRISQEYMRNLLLFCFLTTWSKSILCAVDIMWCVGSYFVRQGRGAIRWIARQSGGPGPVVRAVDVCLALIQLCSVGIQNVNQDK